MVVSGAFIHWYVLLCVLSIVFISVWMDITCLHNKSSICYYEQKNIILNIILKVFIYSHYILNIYTLFGSSNNKNIKSKRDKRGALIFKFCITVLFRLNRPPIGLAAARMDVLVGREHIIPDLAMLTLCCSIASNKTYIIQIICYIIMK